MRLFVAIDLPAQVRAQVAALRSQILGAKWVPPEQLHLTLRFIGNAEPEPIVEALRWVRFAAFPIAITGTGRFPFILWAGIQKSDALDDLALAIDGAVVRTGVPREERLFSPHITLARLKDRRAYGLRNFLELHSGFSSGPFEIDHFTLYHSTLSKTGAVHEVVDVFKANAS